MTEKNLSLDLIGGSFPELAGALRGRAPRILDRFRTLVKEILPSADESTLKDLLDHLPQALEDLAAQIAATARDVQRAFPLDSREHVARRYHAGFNVGELLIEYSILRSIVIDEAAASVRRPLTLEEISVLNAGVDAASRRAVEGFLSFRQREARADAEAHSKYLSFLNHDLRGNLNAVLLAMDLLRRELSGIEKPDGFADNLGAMRRSILATVQQMDLFLLANRLRLGNIRPKPREFDLAWLISYVVASFSVAAAAKGLEIQTDAAPQLKFFTDQELVVAILEILVGNAVKFSGKGRIRITAQPLGKAGLRIGVADEGPGMTALQLKAALSADVMTGLPRKLGLAVARQTAALLGARLTAQSEMGKGSTFYIEFRGKTKNA